jgi:predicted nucleic acid-binding protein
VRVYFDTSVLVPLISYDHFNDRVLDFMERVQPVAVVSDFASAEVSSVIARRVRTGDLTADEGREAFTNFDVWVQQQARQTTVEPTDIRLGEQFVRRLDLTLRAPDAIHIAMALRLDIAIATLDTGLLAAAQRLGCKVIKP